MISSCKDQNPPPGKDTICIKIPNDTSALGRKNHFIPLMSIDIYRRDFDTVRGRFAKAFPEIKIPNTETFNKKSLLEFLSDTTVVGLKFYYGVKPDSANRRSLRLMIVGVDAKGNNVYLKKGSSLAAQAGDDSGGLEYGQCEPPCTD